MHVPSVTRKVGIDYIEEGIIMAYLGYEDKLMCPDMRCFRRQGLILMDLKANKMNWKENVYIDPIKVQSPDVSYACVCPKKCILQINFGLRRAEIAA